MWLPVLLMWLPALLMWLPATRGGEFDGRGGVICDDATMQRCVTRARIGEGGASSIRSVKLAGTPRMMSR